MKTKIGISLMLMLLMITSTFTIVGAADKSALDNQSCPRPIDVVKKVWDREDWVDEYEAEKDEIVTFKITITYNKNCYAPIPMATNLVVIDELPADLTYLDSTPYDESWIDGNLIYWNLTKDYGIVLYDGESLSIEFNASVDDSGEHINYVEVHGWETCCGWPLYGDDSATVYTPSLEFYKLVWDSELGWVDTLYGVQIDNPVRFKIVITYLGIDDLEPMKCMIVEDYLPQCCLEYIEESEDFTYPDDTLFDDPEITVSQDLKYVKYDWSNRKFNLYMGETIEIEFEANVVEYCYSMVENCAYVDIWSCYGCPEPVHLYGEACAYIDCYPPDSSFEKKVWDPNEEEWVEETFQYVTETVTFKIELTYFGNYNLIDVQIIDYLPEITEYADNANIEPSYVSENGRVIWWNISDPVEDGDPLIIIFDALVTGSTGDCECCETNLATVYAMESETQNIVEEEDIAKIITDYYDDPELSYAPNNIYFGKHDSGWTGSESFEIWNSGDQTLTYTISEELDWIEVNPTSGESTGEHDPITVSVINTEGMSGFYCGNVEIASDCGGSGSVLVAIYIEEEEPEPEIQLTISRPRRFLIGRVLADIKNTGEAEVTNIEWEITVKGGFLKRLNMTYSPNSTIDSLAPGESARVSIGKLFGIGRNAIKFKLGRISGTVTARVGEYETSINFKGLVFGRIIFVGRFTAPET